MVVATIESLIKTRLRAGPLGLLQLGSPVLAKPTRESHGRRGDTKREPPSTTDQQGMGLTLIMFSLLQTSRFFAALIVVLDHATLTFGEPRYYGYVPLNGLLESGRYGVDFFFVLSGFTICYAHWEDVDSKKAGTPRRPVRFAHRRFLRIYPTYWVVLTLTLVPLYFSTTQFDERIRSPWYLLAILTLFQGNGNVLTSAWTLTHELAFYALFAMALWRRNIGAIAFAIWFALSCLSFLTPFSFPILGHPEHLGFLVGMVGTYLVRTARIPSPATLFALGLAAFMACCVLAGYFHVAGDINAIVEDPGARGVILPLMFSSLLMIVGLVEMERSGGIAAHPVLRFLGAASFSLYLLHFPVLVVLVKIAHGEHLENHVPLAVLFGASAIIPVIVSLLFYRLIETPLLRYSNTLFGMPRRPGPRTRARYRQIFAAVAKSL